MRKTTDMWFGAALLVTSGLVAACGDVDGGSTPSSSVGRSGRDIPESMSSGSSDSSGSKAPPTPAETNGVAADCAGGDEGGPVPASASELNAWLQKRAYTCWARESVVHDSTGPHGGKVKVFLNAALDASMKAGEEHPEGAVAVKELYGSSTDTVTGWAVGVKTQPESAGGQGWYWYEVFSTEPGATGALEGQGKALCSNCHAGGKDFVLIDHPLR